jgi:nucleoid-associated protein YgaU
MDDRLIRGLLWRARFGGCLLVGAMLLMGGGCRRDVATLEQAERQHPDLAAAREALSRGDREEAERRLTALLRRAPEMPLAHLQYARLLDEAGERPLMAIYHYLRYQELRPEAEKNEVIARRVRQLAGEVGGARNLRTRLEEAEARIAALEAEKAQLMETLAKIQGRSLETLAGPSPSAGPVLPRGSPPLVRYYRVQPGDTLLRIAERLYGDSGQASRIFEANRSQLKNMDAIRAGQVLVIPP